MQPNLFWDPEEEQLKLVLLVKKLYSSHFFFDISFLILPVLELIKYFLSVICMDILNLQQVWQKWEVQEPVFINW